jgi:hypothetical protein
MTMALEDLSRARLWRIRKGTKKMSSSNYYTILFIVIVMIFKKKKKISFSDQDYQKIPINGYISLPIRSTETQFLLFTAKRNCWITKYIITEGKQTKQKLNNKLAASLCPTSCKLMT